MKKWFTAYRAERLLTLFLGILIMLLLYWSLTTPQDYGRFEVSDWLINYQGGFLRRGLIGEVLWQVYQWHPYSVKQVLLIVQFSSFALFAWLIWRIFRRKRWSLLPILLPFACAFFRLSFYRRDFLMLLFCYAVYTSFFRYLSAGKVRWLLLSIFLMILSIVIYEPIFFVMVPILVWIYWQHIEGTFFKRLWKISLVFALPIIGMALVCTYSSSVAIAEAINASWQALFDAYPQEETMFFPHNIEAFSFLKNNSLDVFALHIKVNFLYREGWAWVASLCALVVLWIFSYLLTAKVLSVDSQRKEVKTSSDSVLLGNLMLFQMVMMIPMFTVLSCDYGRTIPYCIYTSFILVYQMQQTNINSLQVPLLSSLSEKILSFSSRYTFLNSPWFYFFMILFIPLRSYRCPHLLDNVLFHWGQVFVAKMMNIFSL